MVDGLSLIVKPDFDDLAQNRRKKEEEQRIGKSPGGSRVASNFHTHNNKKKAPHAENENDSDNLEYQS
jgi:hypothetical protein